MPRLSLGARDRIYACGTSLNPQADKQCLLWR